MQSPFDIDRRGESPPSETGDWKANCEAMPNHLVSIYTNQEVKHDVLVTYFARAIEQNERCIFIGPRAEQRRVRTALTTLDNGVEEGVPVDRVDFIEPREADGTVGDFDADSVLGELDGLLDPEHAHREYDGVRIAGDSHRLDIGHVDAEEVMAYESRINALDCASENHILCHYDRNQLAQEELAGVIRTHPYVLFDGILCENTHYYPPAEFQKNDYPPLDVDRVERSLVEKAQARGRAHRRHQELRASERRYRHLVETFPHGAVGRFDQELTFTAVGGELLADLYGDDVTLVGDSVLDHCPIERREAVKAHCQGALRGESHECELRYLGRDVVSRVVPVRDTSGDVTAGMIVVLDISERRSHERQLEQARENLEQYARGLSHDLGAPLTTVSSYLQLLERRYGERLDGEAEEFIEFATDGVTRIREIIDGITTEYTEFDAERAEMHPVDLVEVLDRAKADLQSSIAESEATIQASELPEVYGNEQQLCRVFLNLIDNAIKYASEDPPNVRVSADRRSDEWVISVADNGIGIPPEQHEPIFEMFARVDEDEDHPGSGVGLALCKQIVDQQGGDIWVDSEPGQGATFCFTVPAVADETR